MTQDCLCCGVHIVASYVLCRAEQSCEDGIQASIRACVSQWVMFRVLCCAQLRSGAHPPVQMEEFGTGKGQVGESPAGCQLEHLYLWETLQCSFFFTLSWL